MGATHSLALIPTEDAHYIMMQFPRCPSAAQASCRQLCGLASGQAEGGTSRESGPVLLVSVGGTLPSKSRQLFLKGLAAPDAECLKHS